jgi:hypothetical protein
MRSAKSHWLLGIVGWMTLGVAMGAAAAESAAGGAATAESAAPASIDKPLLAYWTFDEAAGPCLDHSGNNYHTVPVDNLSGQLSRTGGVFGRAMRFSGQHHLAVPGTGLPDTSEIQRISFSAWVQVTRFDRYNEIFRKEDGDRRVLFSFQEDGRVLALGLNVNGYVECDAPIDPKWLLDGHWHHCAATFDGQTFRVYLDGKEIGSLARAGNITAGGSALGCIGSTNGNECLQGMMDDLRIYTEALSADEVARLYLNGIEAISLADQQVAEYLPKVYQAGADLAETLANVRRNMAELGIEPGSRLTQVLAARLTAEFGPAVSQLSEYTGIAIGDLLAARENEVQLPAAGRLLELLLEYRPLTQCQWDRQTPEQIRRWQEYDAIAARFQALKAEGEAARFSPEWVRWMLDVGPRIEFRPKTHEPVAPYVTPQTPETRDLTAEQARAALEIDWLHQAGQNTAPMQIQGGRVWHLTTPVSVGSPTPERIREEIRWSRELAARIEAEHVGAVSFAAELENLDQLQQLADKLTDGDRQLYFRCAT